MARAARGALITRPVEVEDHSSARLWRRPVVLWALCITGVAIVVFAVPAAFGVPWLVGDNLIQNFPLRVLVGTDLRAGHFPLWDPYIWSGSPLLAGFNAGAAYPLTWLFAVVPHVPAWVVGQVAAVVVAGSGTLTLLRMQGRSTIAAGLGAVTFSFGGFMAAQSVHIDLVEAGGWLVWAFVALERIGRRPPGRSVLPWVALLGVALGLMVLSGAAEPILDGGAALVLYTLWSLWRSRGRRWQVLAAVAGGAVLGVLVSAAELLPGSLLQVQSQRALHNYWYFTSGSMNKSLTVLLLDPLLLGGAHSVPLSYIGTYNLPEISGYVGILAVMGALGLLAKRHRRSPESSQWWIWYAIAVVGLVLVWGDFTPLGHLEYILPFYNRQRLLSRNWLEVDLALVVLFAAWLDHALLSPAPDAGSGDGTGSGGRRRWSSEVVLPLVPVVGVVLLQVMFVAGGAWFPHFLHVPQHVSYGTLWKQDVFLCVPSAIALAAGWIVVNRRHLGPRIGRAVVALVVVDLVVFNVMVQTVPQVHSAAGTSAPAATLASLVSSAPRGPDGTAPRFALYDPDRYYSAETQAVGQPDLNILRDLSSVQGYGALAEADYDDATGTHLQGNLTVSSLSNGAFAALNLGVLLTPPQYFLSLVVAPPGAPAHLPGTVGPTPAATPLPPVPPDRRVPTTTPAAPPTSPANYSQYLTPTRSVPLASGATDTWFFGTVLAVSAVELPVSGAGYLRVGLLSSTDRAVQWLEGPTAVPGRGSLLVRAPGAPSASGVVVERVPGPVTAGALSVGPAVVYTADQGTYRLDGGLRDTVTAPRWHFVGTLDDFAVFEETPSGSAFLQPASAGTVRVVESSTWGVDKIEVRTDTPATLVRDVTYASGWQAVLTPAPGSGRPASAARSVPVARHDLVQAVRVPPGEWVVTFRYRPHRVEEGLAGTALGALAAVGLVTYGRRRGARPGTGPGRTDAGARPAAARSARAPGGAAPDPAPSAPEPQAAPPPRRGP